MTTRRAATLHLTVPLIAAVTIAVVAGGQLVLPTFDRPIEYAAQRVVATPEPVEAPDEEVSDSSPGEVPLTESPKEQLSGPRDEFVCSERSRRGVWSQEYLIQADVAEVVPGLGGAWVEGEVLNVWLTDPSQENAEIVKRELVKRWGDDWYDREAVVVHHANFTLACLMFWYGELVNVLNLPGAVWSSVGLQQNRIKFGFEDPESQGPAVYEMARAKGVPEASILIEQSGPIVPD